MSFSYPTNARGIIVVVDLADFALQEQPEDNLVGSLFTRPGIMAHIPRPLSQSIPWNCMIQ